MKLTNKTPNSPLVKKPFKFTWNTFLLVLLILEVTVFGMTNSKFLNPKLIFTGVNDYLSICIISLFVTMVMITGGIDIQAYSFIGLTSIIIGVLWQDFGFHIWAAAGVAVLVCALCGALTGFLIGFCGVQAMVVTLGGSFLFSGLALLISTLSSTESYQGISGFPDYFRFITKTKLFDLIPLQIIIYILLVIIAYTILHKTKYGRKIFLVGINASAAEYSGINSRWIKMSTYILSSIAASITGIIMTSYLGTAKSDLGGSSLTMNIITAVVLGGTLSTGGSGSILGTVLASLIIGLLRFGMPLCFKVNTQYLDIPIGVLLLVVILGRSAASNPKVSGAVRKLLKKEK